MERQKKSPGGDRGSGKSAGSAIINQHLEYSTILPRKQYHALSSLLDQALHRYEHAADLARIYATEAEKHRAILHSLQSLIPPASRGRGGAA